MKQISISDLATVITRVVKRGIHWKSPITGLFICEVDESVLTIEEKKVMAKYALMSEVNHLPQHRGIYFFYVIRPMYIDESQLEPSH